MTLQFRLSVDGHADLEVVRGRGVERLSRCYRFDLDVVGPSAVAPTQLLRRDARFELEVGGHVRRFEGRVERIEHGTFLQEGRRRLRVRFVPHLHALAHRRVSRVFQELSTVDIARRVLADHHVAIHADLSEALPRREICIQHDETDLEFLERLFADEGCAYRVEMRDVGGRTVETVVLLDAARSYSELTGGKVLVYHHEENNENAMFRAENAVQSFVESVREEPERVVLTAYDFERPRHLHQAQAGAESSGFVHEHHGPYGEMQVHPQDPKMVLDQARRHARTFRGRSECARLAPGYVVELQDHREASLSAEYAIVAVEHHIEQSKSGDEGRYANAFRAVQRSFLFRPARPRRRVRQSRETATVVGPSGTEIHTDHLGRVKVRFHWDLENTRPGESSCWIRVMQSWSGPSYGAQFVPRVGMEVVIDYLGGDPDRPVISGCLPNAIDPPPFPLPGASTRTGWRTRSSPTSPSGGANELSFDDKSGAEMVRLAGHRDLDVHVGHAMTTTVGQSSSVTVASHHQMTVGGVSRTTVAGASVSHFGSAELAVTGSYEERVHGHKKTELANGAELRVSGAYLQAVTGDRRDTVKGTWTCEATRHVMTIGDSDGKGHAETHIRGTSIFHADGRAVIESHEAIVLSCGDSRIEIAPNGVTIRAPSIHLKARDSLTAEGSGPALKLTDRAEMSADDLRLRGKNSSLSLDDNATLKGSSISLGKGEAREPKKDEPTSPGTKRFSVRLLDDDHQPYSGKRYELRAHGKTFEGTTGGDGLVAHAVPEDAKAAELEVWMDKYPTGRRRTYTLEIDAMPGPETIPGACARLNHLGYYRGPTDRDDIDPILRDAIVAFQRDHHLEPTGRLDDATKAQLTKLHGH